MKDPGAPRKDGSRGNTPTAPPSTVKSAGPGPILFATDFSSASEAALNVAIDLARDRSAELLIAHVYSKPALSATDDLFAPGLSGDIEATACHDAMKRLEPLLQRARNAGVRARALTLEGTAEGEIVAAARAARAQLIVNGTRGRRGLRRLLFGSVAARIVARASCPVLTIRHA